MRNITTGTNDIKKQFKDYMKIKDFDSSFQEFKESKIYGETVLYLISRKKEEEPDWDELHRYLEEHFKDYRAYLYHKAKTISNSDMDFCILAMAGVKQKDMPLILGLKPATIRNRKLRLKDKLPPRLWKSIFKVKHSVY